MAIFSRRVIQRMLDENRIFLPKDVVNNHAKNLNSFNRGALSTEWEVLVLNALSKIGKLEYEKQFSGSKKPDIFFTNSEIPEFIADITAIDDGDYENNNPQKYFYECVKKYFKKNKSSPGGLCFQIESQKVGPYRDRKVKLCLPHKSQIPDFIKKHFKVIIESIKNYPNKPFQKTISTDDAHIKVSYQPNNRSSIRGGWTSYSEPYSLKKNPIYNRLKYKAGQIKKSGFKGVAGVFLCDGGCSALHAITSGSEVYSRKEIIEEIFRCNSTLSFIIVLSIEEKHDLFWTNIRRSVKSEFYRNPDSKFIIGRKFWEELKKICDYFPEPEQVPINALYRIESRKHEGLSYLGGYTINTDNIKISSRGLTELLAGVIDTKKFEQLHGGNDTGKNMMETFFSNQLLAGKTIKEISVEKTLNDDDWIKTHMEIAIRLFQNSNECFYYSLINCSLG